MTDTRIDRMWCYGTNAERLAFTPDPPPGVLVTFYESDTGDAFVWDTDGGPAAWATFGGGGGITQITGDITAGPGSGSQAATIANNAVTTAKINNSAVTLAKIANQADATILGNNTGGAAAPVALTASQARTLLALVVGTNVQAWDADLDALAALSGTDTIYRRSGAGTWSAVTIGPTLSFSSGTLGTAFRGALVSKASDQTAANYSSDTAITWDTESYDTDAIHDTGSNTSRLTVPAGVTKVIVSAAFVASSVIASSPAFFQIKKNGANTFTGWPIASPFTSSTQVSATISSPVLTVTAGD